MKNVHDDLEGIQIEGFQLTETSSYVSLGRSMNMVNDMRVELDRT